MAVIRFFTAAGFVCAVALLALCAEATTTPGPGNVDGLLAFLRSMTPMRIVYKKNKNLCLGVDANNKVVLVSIVGSLLQLRDNKQLWFLHSEPFKTLSDGKQPFALVNVYSVLNASQPQAILTPTNGSYFPLQLAPYNLTTVPASMLWVDGPKSSNPWDTFSFVKIKQFRNESWFLDGWEMSAQDGATVAVYPATHDEPNIYWSTQIFHIN